MSERAARLSAGAEGATRRLAAYAASIDYRTLPEEVREVARHCCLDWLGVTLAGAREPAARLVLAEALEEGGAAQASIVGDGRNTTARLAALVNGTASHALDYDDVHLVMPGHPTVPVMPAVLALAEREGASGEDLLAAFVAGVEVECRVGELVTEAHYDAGWHATGTLGTFGAAAGCARLLGLDAAATAAALGIAAAQAAGLKSMFGTMCKPLHAGKAAANGLLAAALARRGFTSNPDALECMQGFAATQSSAAPDAAVLDDLGQRFHLPETLFKHHAACYGTHAAIEAAARLREAHAWDAGDLESVEVRVTPANLRICNLPVPATGLEAKFSLRLTTAMALAGRDTGDTAVYTDDLCRDEALVALRDKVNVVADPQLGHAQSEVVVRTRDGVVYRERGDVSAPERDLARQRARLEVKFERLAAPVVGAARAGEVRERVQEIDRASSLGELASLLVPV